MAEAKPRSVQYRTRRKIVIVEDPVLLAANISDGAKILYLLLCRHAIAGRSLPPQARLAELRGVSVPTVARNLRELRQVRLIERKRGGSDRPAMTWILDPFEADLELPHEIR